MVLDHYLARLIRRGQLTVIDSRGRRRTYGRADAGLSSVTIRLRTRAASWRLARNPSLGLGESYMNGDLIVEKGDLRALINLLTANLGAREKSFPETLLNTARRGLRFIQQYNPVPRAKRNVAHHYDLSGHLYDLFLDADRQYSCAYFTEPGDTLEIAQRKKCRHLAAKLLLKPGLSVLDIGSGWGGLALYLARTSGVDVTGITLSEEQYIVSERRAAEADIDSEVSFGLADYRRISGTFDRIVSVGMFEHVGVYHYKDFFTQIRRLLAPDGVAVIHSIGRSGPPTTTDPFIRKYIFPGGYIPALSETLRAIEKTGLKVTDIEILHLHYAETLKHWHSRLRANWDKIAAIYDQRFCRMWEYYLVVSEMAFRNLDLMVFQIQLAHHATAVPRVRDYMVDSERKLPLDVETDEAEKAAVHSQTRPMPGPRRVSG